MGKKIIVLGGGAGGLVVANRLRKALSQEHEITLVDQGKNHIFYPSFPWLMLEWRNSQQVQRV
ncbi:FAD-dependent oxidoreductase [Deltaproteobacteria bacterium TL4]